MLLSGGGAFRCFRALSIILSIHQQNTLHPPDFLSKPHKYFVAGTKRIFSAPTDVSNVMQAVRREASFNARPDHSSGS